MDGWHLHKESYSSGGLAMHLVPTEDTFPHVVGVQSCLCNPGLHRGFAGMGKAGYVLITHRAWDERRAHAESVQAEVRDAVNAHFYA